MGKFLRGHKHSEEMKKKLSLAAMGRKMSEETKQKISKGLKGHPGYNKGMPRLEETKRKISQANKGENNYWFGKSLSLEHRKKISLSNYKNGNTSLNEIIRHSQRYIFWRSQIFERDNWTCQTCNKRGTELNAHHKKSFIKIITEFNIKNMEDAEKCLELWDLNNGVTLCKECHDLTKFGKYTMERISKSRGMI